LFRRDALLNVHLPDHVVLAVEARELAADVEKSVAHERHRFRFLRRGRRREREQGRSRTPERRCQTRVLDSSHHVLPLVLFDGSSAAATAMMAAAQTEMIVTTKFMLVPRVARSYRMVAKAGNIRYRMGARLRTHDREYMP